MTSSYPPPPSRDPPPSLPRRRNDVPSSSTASSSTSNKAGTTPAMDSIKSKLPSRVANQGNEDTENDHEEEGFDVIGYWAIASVCWLLVMAIPLLLFPRLLAFISQSPAPLQHLSSSASTASGKHARGSHYDDLTPLEKVLAQQLGWGCVGVGVVLACIIASPAIPQHFPNLDPSTLAPPPTPALHPTTSLRLSILLAISSLFTLLAFLLWNNSTVGAGLSGLVGGGLGVLGIWGFWVGVFGFDRTRGKKTEKSKLKGKLSR